MTTPMLSPMTTIHYEVEFCTIREVIISFNLFWKAKDNLAAMKVPLLSTLFLTFFVKNPLAYQDLMKSRPQPFCIKEISVKIA